MSVTEQKYWKSRLNENTLRKHDNILQRTIKKVKLYLSPQVQKVGNDYKDWIMSFRGSFIVFVFLALALLIFGINNGQYYNIFILAFTFKLTNIAKAYAPIPKKAAWPKLI